jgi:hypothetical protein
MSNEILCPWLSSLGERFANLIYTNSPIDGWGLRGHLKEEKCKGWFQMTILSSHCASREEAFAQALLTAKQYSVTIET